MKKLLKNPFLWTTLVLLVGIIVLLICILPPRIPSYIALNKNDPISIEDDLYTHTIINRYTDLYRTLDEMRESQKHCNSAEEAIKIVLNWYSEIFDEKKQGRDIYVIYSEEDSVYFVLFQLKDSEYMRRLTIDEYTGAIVEVAKVR